jgi:hypothetical protein
MMKKLHLICASLPRRRFAVGLLLGLGIGLATDSAAIGVALGVALGLTIGGARGCHLRPRAR